uniref:Nucleosome assembly protein 1-like 1 n=1 Tax=Caenorhabditis japonica TaxID=281687 RepID=A0A8R1E2A9_CAEJA
MSEHEHIDAGLMSSNFDMIQSLPLNVKQRVCALKKLQTKSIQVESDFYKRVHELEIEFEAKFKGLFDERRAIVTGEKEPSPEDVNVPILEGLEAEQLAELYKHTEADPSVKGIKDFWLTAFKTHDLVAESMEEHDLPILSYLTDVTTSASKDPAGFVLEFHFAQNPYFTDSKLTKQYVLAFDPEEDAPLSFDGPHVVRAIGCNINWADGKNVTKKAVKKKQKKGANAGKFLTKTVKADSFFNFFEPPKSKDERNEDEDDDSAEEFLELDYELGQAIRDTVIPRAVLFFTGELQSDEMFDFQGEDGDEVSDYSDDDA